jgi:ZIP family zinc transporter
MTNVIFYATISVLPLIGGALLGSFLKVKEKTIGAITSFGAGALIAALAFGLMEESFRLGGLDNAVFGFVLGGLLFLAGDLLIIKIGGRTHKRTYDVEAASSGWGIVLGAVLDGIPESLALGIGMVLNPRIGFLVLVAIFLSNLPEAISSAYDLKKSGQSFRQLIAVWALVALISFVFVILGYTIFSAISPNITATFQSLAAGAILAMVASTMMPEAYKESGTGSAILAVLGFLVIFVISKYGV